MSCSFLDRFVSGLVLLLRGVDGNDHCPWCHYLSCVPTPLWKCKPEQVYCEVTYDKFPFFSPYFFTSLIKLKTILKTHQKRSAKKKFMRLSSYDYGLMWWWTRWNTVSKGTPWAPWGKTQSVKRSWSSRGTCLTMRREPHAYFTNYFPDFIATID